MARRHLNGRHAKTAMALYRAALGPQYRDDPKSGRRIRIFTAENWCTPEDVRLWLLGTRAVEIEDALEHVSENVLHWLIKEDYLRRDRAGGWHWITAKAAIKYDLPRVMNCPFPK